VIRGLVLMLGLAACAQGAELEDPQLAGTLVLHAGEPEPSPCGMAFDPDPELGDATEAAVARWCAATGCDVRVEAGGVPIRAQGFVFIGDGPEAVYDSDPQLERRQVCGATLTRAATGETVGIFVSTSEQRCDIRKTVMHETAHTMATPGTHATDGIGAEGGTPEQTNAVTSGTLEWVCERLPCSAFVPEAQPVIQ
jgi:hypothetical protein